MCEMKDNQTNYFQRLHLHLPGE